MLIYKIVVDRPDVLLASMPMIWKGLRKYSICFIYIELILDSRNDADFRGKFGSNFHRVVSKA